MSGKSSHNAQAGRVQRHWAGKAPAFSTAPDKELDEDSISASINAKKKAAQDAPSAALSFVFAPPVKEFSIDDVRQSAVKESKPQVPPVHITDRRMLRLQRSAAAAVIVKQNAPVQVEAVEPRHRRQAPEIIRRHDLEISSPKVIEKSHPEEVPEVESEEDSEDEPAFLFKPVFVPKNARSTVHLQDELDKEAAQRTLAKQSEDVVRQQESQRLAEESIRRELAAFDVKQDDQLSKIDDTDYPTELAESHTAWQVRELERIKRDRKLQEDRDLEKQLLEHRREMTDAERRADELDSGRDRFHKEKGQARFMQKYHHKGAFYQDDEILQRDFTAPTQDAFNMEIVPEIMQRRQTLGMKGGTKWTHLVNEDTTQRDAAWSQYSEVNLKMLKRQGGMHDDDLSKPSRKKR